MFCILTPCFVIIVSYLLVIDILIFKLTMFNCTHCPEKVFQSEKSLKLHDYSCHKVLEEPVCCDECGKTFKNQFKLSKHKIIHKKVYCEICKIHCSKQNYKRHQQEKHYNNNVSSEHQCDICLKTFGRSDNLMRHKSPKIF